MRKIYLPWMIAVFGVFGTVYGSYLLAYHFNHGNGLSVWSLVLLILGSISLITFLILFIPYYLKNKKKTEEPTSNKEVIDEEPIQEDIPQEEQPEEKPVVEEIKKETKEQRYTPREERSSYSHSIYESSSSTVYVKQLGFGPLLRVDGYRILDMRTNTYYRIENNMVKQEGYGPLYEIRGNQIKNTFGGYLYEISGSNINKIYGGFYASISGNYITLYDLSVKYEMTDSLNKTQLLAVVVLLFGKY